MKKVFSRILAVLFLLQTINPVAYAEPLSLQAPDIEPPVILFNAGDTEIADGIQTFSAKVTDNRGIANVTLYYKNTGDASFKPKVMTPQGNDVYSADLTLDSVISNKLEVYIRADDVSGNSVFEGQKFSPFAYTVIPAAVAEDVTPVGGTPAAKDKEGMSTLTMVLIGLGVLALAGGGGGGGGGGDETPTGTITITTELPD